MKKGQVRSLGGSVDPEIPHPRLRQIIPTTAGTNAHLCARTRNLHQSEMLPSRQVASPVESRAVPGCPGSGSTTVSIIFNMYCHVLSPPPRTKSRGKEAITLGEVTLFRMTIRSDAGQPSIASL